MRLEPPVAQELDPALRDAARLVLSFATLDPAAERQRPDSGLGRRAAAAARYFLLHRPSGFRNDCSGFVSAAYSRAGVAMDGAVVTLWDLAVAHDALHWDDPSPGDLVFWENTYDRDRDGKWNDPFTHVGMVVDMEPDGTVVFAHGGTTGGRTLGTMNLRDPHTRRTASGKEINSSVRQPRPGDPPGARYLAAELWIGYATVGRDQDWLVDADSLYPDDE